LTVEIVSNVIVTFCVFALLRLGANRRRCLTMGHNIKRLRPLIFTLSVVGVGMASCGAPKTEIESTATFAVAFSGVGDPVPCGAWANAVVGNTASVTVNSQSLVDSYSSNIGAYGGSDVGRTAIVRAATTIVNNGGVIQGASFPQSVAGLAVVPVPTGATKLPLGSQSPGSLNINDAKSSITLAPGNYVAANISVNSPGSITISPAGQVRIWVTGNLNLGGTENLNGIPRNLAFLVTSSGSVNVNSGGSLFGLIYAPTSGVNLNSKVLGSVIGSQVTLNSGSAVHFDVDSVCNPGLARLEQDTGVSWVMTSQPSGASDITAFVRPKGDPGVALPSGTQPQDAAMAFLKKYPDIFGLQDPTTELALKSAHIGSSGIGYASFQQVVNGVPVLGAGVTFMFNPAGRIDNITSQYIPGIRGISTTPTIDGAAALASAQADIVTRFSSGTLGASVPSAPALLFIVPQPTGGAKLAYLLSAIFAGQDNQLVHFSRDYLIDASTGLVLSSVDGNPRQFAGPGAPVQATGEGTIEQVRNLPLARQFTAFSANPPSGAPFFMQPSASHPTIFVERPSPVNQTVVPVSSNDLNSWDTAGLAPGEAVDAYVYFNYILSWWADPARGARSSYNNLGYPIKILVHYPNLANNALWDKSNKEFHVGESSTAVFPASAAVDDLGHEFQHAVNDSVLGIYSLFFNYPDAGPLDESLGDVFGQFIEFDFHSANSLAYLPTPELEGEAQLAGNPHPTGGWVRNLIDPHLASQFQGPSPDSMKDCLYDSSNDEHVNGAVPSRAWSLATFGGIDSTSGVGVNPSGKLDMALSEELYLMLIQNPPSLAAFRPGKMYWNMAQALAGFARMRLNAQSPQLSTIACAWLGVDVFETIDVINLGFVPELCATGPQTPCVSQGAGQPKGGGGCGLSSNALDFCPGTQCQDAPPGPSCSTDGTTVYTCDGNGSTVAGNPCDNGCVVSGLAPAACAAATGPGAGGGGGPCAFLLPGTYCGGNGSGATDILYTCGTDPNVGGGTVLKSVFCHNGCQKNTAPAASAPPPGCSGAGAGSCFSLPQGDYCGADQVCGDPTVLYHCDENHNISAVMTCLTGCSVAGSGSQVGGADNCTGPFGDRVGKDSCAEGPQTVVPPGSAKPNCPPGQKPPNCCPVGEGPCAAIAGGILSSDAVNCSSGSAEEPDFPDGTYCGPGLFQKITLCQGGVNHETRTCSGGCKHNGNGHDTCIGDCAGRRSGNNICASDGKTLEVCDLTEVVATETCDRCISIPEPPLQNPPKIMGVCFSPCASLPNGTNCASDGTGLFFCQNGHLVETQDCTSGCQGSQTGNDTCIGPCTNLSDGSDCSSDGSTLLQCLNGNLIGQQPCARGCQGTQTGNDACSP
jgi:Zn-dependent metalloprotease